jgi:ABC-type Fe3+-hydroxamate transport system substrate-binding protein
LQYLSGLNLRQENRKLVASVFCLRLVSEIASMLRTTDQTGRTVEIPEFPQRIISLVPSQTELLHDLGLGDRVVGITKFCVHPSDWHQNKTRIGGTKILKHGVIDSLEPDLIIANKEENTREDVELLSTKYPVWVSDVNDLTSALQMIRQVGKIVHAKNKSEELAERIAASFDLLVPTERLRTVYLIWRKPFMAVGRNTFIDDMLTRCGFDNVIDLDRYPEVREADLLHLDPELILFSSEPFPFKEEHLQPIARLLPHTHLELVDGEPFSWYGSRLVNSVAYFTKLLNRINMQKA